MEGEEFPSFDKWLKTGPENWTWDWPHQLLIYDRLESITRGDSKRLMIFMPPRHSKSETVTVRYTAWRMARTPEMNVILGCYNQRLANRFSRKIRRIADREVAISRERRGVDEWETAAGGTLCAVGVGGGVTGFGASLIVIDDPVKSRARAESRTARESVYEWFNDDIYTRLEPGAAIILIQTRWHEDDLAGRLLKEMAEGGEQWAVLSLPALAESGTPDVQSSKVQSSSFSMHNRQTNARTLNSDPPADAGTPNTDPLQRAEGDALCPDRYDRDALLRIRTKIGSYAFSALYQQSPVPREGGLFKRKWFERIIEREPAGLRWFRGYDLAVSTSTSADHTASFRCALDENEDLYIAGGFRGRIEYPQQRRYVLERMAEEPDTTHGIEAALHGRGLVQDLLRDRSVKRVRLRAVRVDGDKYTRALSWSSLAEAGKVVLVRGPWIRDFLDEVCTFPDSRHDDQVDAVSLAFGMLNEERLRKLARGF